MLEYKMYQDGKQQFKIYALLVQTTAKRKIEIQSCKITRKKVFHHDDNNKKVKERKIIEKSKLERQKLLIEKI